MNCFFAVLLISERIRVVAQLVGVVRFQVTRGQFRRFSEAVIGPPPKFMDPPQDQPVENVSPRHGASLGPTGASGAEPPPGSGR